MSEFIAKIRDFLDDLMCDAVDGIVDEDGYYEPIWKTILLLPIRAILIPILLFVFAVLVVLDSFGRF